MKRILIIVTLVFLVFSCGKKGPIDLSTDYSDSNINGPSEVTTVNFEQYYTQRESYDLQNHHQLNVGFSKGREVRGLIDFNISNEINLDNGPFYLRLYIAKNLSKTFSFKVARFSSEWIGSQATWEERVTDTNWDWQTDITNPKTIDETNLKSEENRSYIELDISEYVEYWKNNPEENFGIVLYSESTQTDYNFISVYSNTSSEENRPEIVYEYTDNDETVTQQLNAGVCIHIGESFNSASLDSTFTMGDGFYPIFEIDFSKNNIDPKWEILEAYLVFSNYDLSVIEKTYNFNLSDIDPGLDYFYTSIVRDSTLENMTLSDSTQSPISNYEGNFAINITDILNKRLENNDTMEFTLYPQHFKTQMRATEFLSSPELKIIYRENPEG